MSEEHVRRRAWYGSVARMSLGHMARGNHSEKSMSKWDKGERPNLWGSLGPHIYGADQQSR